jgi:hypothetical protein
MTAIAWYRLVGKRSMTVMGSMPGGVGQLELLHPTAIEINSLDQPFRFCSGSEYSIESLICKPSGRFYFEFVEAVRKASLSVHRSASR